MKHTVATKILKSGKQANISMYRSMHNELTAFLLFKLPYTCLYFMIGMQCKFFIFSSIKNVKSQVHKSKNVSPKHFNLL